MAGGRPDPAIVVLVGASGSGKSTWAAREYRRAEIVSSDELRGIVGSGRHDLDASTDAFALLDQIVAARARRGLTCVIDTLGLDPERRRGYLATARASGLPAVAVVFDAPDALARERNAGRDRPVPAAALARQLAAAGTVHAEIATEGWDHVEVQQAAYDSAPTAPAAPERADRPSAAPADGPGEMDFVLQLSRFSWGDDPARWLADVAAAAEEAGFAGLALMDHLIQIPQVERAWSPIPEPFVTLGLLAGLDTGLRLGTLVSPITFRAAGIIAKSVATLDALSGGRAFLGLGAGWWEREHAAFGLPFPSAGERSDTLESAIETIRALWAPGTKAHAGARVTLPETTCYPRPVSTVPIIVGGAGERRTLQIAARWADGCNLPSALDLLDRKIAILREHCERAGRDPAEVAVTVLDLPVVGRDRDEVWTRVEQLRGRANAATFARTHHAGTHAQQRARYATLAERGVRTVFVAPGHLATAQDVLDLAPMLIS
jgi:alkanesulfonate monooxygenase SsuD/methylene tetrahydromethanopterin reductase-like flavin-dependent oxidoreductase (luciferase family)/predicted kinase